MRYVFCVSTGRSGTGYLSRLLAQAEECCSLHEPAPILNREPMHEFLRGNEAPLRALMAEKVGAIEAARAGRRFYAESNHCFIKGFGWLLPDHLPVDELRIVVLRRDPVAVRSSLSRISCSPFLPAGRQWIITPTASPRHVPLPTEFSFPMARFHLYRFLSRTAARPRIVRTLTGGSRSVPGFIERYEHALLDWYIRETEARWLAYRERFPEIRFIEVDLETLNQPKAVLGLFQWLEMRPRPGWEDAVARATNLKRGR